MNLTKVTFSQMILQSADLLIQEVDYFSEIDSRFGDGDHGIAIKKIAEVIRTNVENWQEQSLKHFIDQLGAAILLVSGGSAGPLWGTFIGGLALPLQEDTREIDSVMLKAMLASALAEMESITTARVGDKTMMDTLIPAVQAAQEAGGNPSEVLQAAAAAAEQGAKDTEKYVSRFGRAKYYKEQTIGTPDAGATSLKVFFEGLASGAK
jgi:phosphoenolpyruvate---glycerone phosphotransferase subunit DhaL